jgi:hypothetical protein
MAANPDLPEQTRLLMNVIPSVVVAIMALKFCSALAVYWAVAREKRAEQPTERKPAEHRRPLGARARRRRGGRRGLARLGGHGRRRRGDIALRAERAPAAQAARLRIRHGDHQTQQQHRCDSQPPFAQEARSPLRRIVELRCDAIPA